MVTITLTMGKALGRRPARLSLPVGPIGFAAGIIEDLACLVRRQTSVLRARIDKYTEDLAFDRQRFQSEPGFVPRYDLAASWQDTVEEMRKTREL